MIQIRHFMTERDEKAPRWVEAEKYLNQFSLGDYELVESKEPTKPRAQILNMQAYPTGPYHHLVLVLWIDGNTEAKQV